MFLLIWLVLIAVAVCLLALPYTLWRRDILNRYSGSRLISCPENQQASVVSFDVKNAALTEMDGRPDLRLAHCSRWPERCDCNQACLAQAVQTEPYKQGEPKIRAKQVYHVPILLAAFAAWYVGAIWHSQYLFRPRWIAAVGLAPAEVKQVVWWIWPHLLTFGVWLLFAYGVGCLMAVWHRKGVLQGIAISALLCACLAASTSFAIAKLPDELLKLEAGYVLVAVLAVGAIVGGLRKRLVTPSH